MARRPVATKSPEVEERASRVLAAMANVARPEGLTAPALELLSRAILSPRIDPSRFGVHHAYELPDPDSVAGRDLIARGFVEIVGSRPLLTVAAVINANLWGEV